MQQNKDVFLWLVRMGIKAESACLQPIITEAATVNWDAIQDLATQHGLSAVVLDGIEKLSDQQRPPKLFLLEWIGETLQGYEYRYELYQRAIAELAEFYNSHGFKMMVLKGYACSVNWPKPEHRPCGDIDIWMYGQYKEADTLLAKKTGIKVNNAIEHHTKFTWQGFLVENHYDFMNVHHHKSNRKMEKIFKSMAREKNAVRCHIDPSTGSGQVSGFYLPSANLHALFLLRHMMAHFAAEQITLRHVLDWGFFVKAHTNEIDWPWLVRIINQYGMTPAYNIFNAICVEDLGFDAGIFPEVQTNLSMKDKVLNEILNPEFGKDLPKNLFRRVRFKIRRWRGSAWKHDLCYNDGMWSAFWSGVWGHLLKPTTI